jgi:hypothetical protein
MIQSLELTKKTQIAIWLTMVCCWIIQALAVRHTLDADGISYLNIADACLHGNWHALVNGYWSPGLPFLLVLWMKLFHPIALYVPLAFRLFAVTTLIFALLAYEYFVNAFFRFRNHLFDVEQYRDRFISDSAVRVLGYSLFLWITVFFTPARLDQPEILVFALYLLATAQCLEIVSNCDEWRNVLVLGSALGCAYLVKAVMFPLSFAFFVALVLDKRVRRSIPQLAISVGVFLALGLPFLVILSHAKGRFTYGDAGAVNYLQMMGSDGRESLGRSVIGLTAAPHVEEFTEVLFLGTYPPWADPSFTYRPKPFHFHLLRQLNRIHVVLRVYFDLFVVQLGGLVCGLLILVLYSQNITSFASNLFDEIVLWLPAVVGFSLFALVRAEGRFLAGFTVVVFAAYIAAIRFNDAESGEKIVKSVVPAIVGLLLAQILITVGHDGLKALSTNNPDWEVVEALNEMGIRAGDRVGYLGDTLGDHAWAYLGNFSIAAEIPEEDQATYWAATNNEKQQVNSWIAKTGAKVIVTRNIPLSGRSAGWKRVGSNDYFILEIP